MKRLLVLAAVTSLVCVSLKAQGTIYFLNSTGSKVINGTTGQPVPLNSPDFIAGLYWGPEGTAEGSLNLLGTTMAWSPFPGVFNGGNLTVPNVAGGTRVTVQIRAWAAGFVDYAAALNGGGYTGKGILQLITLGNAGSPPSPPPALILPYTLGDTQLAGLIILGGPVGAIPEPSAIALELLGLGAIALFRRRK